MMNAEEEAYERGFRAGKREGRKEGRILGMKKILKQYEITHSNIIAEIITKNKLVDEWVPKAERVSNR